MYRCFKRVALCAAAAVIVWTGALLLERKQLSQALIRFHVVANSDTQRDQAIKLQVRDAVLASLESGMQDLGDVEVAKQYLRENLPKIQSTARNALVQAGVSSDCVVTLCQEAFDTRHYDTFSLPAGVYESLRIVIGEGMGHNWWCVAFPDLCGPNTGAEFQAAAAGAGFSEPLTRSLCEEEYEIRFFLLDALGRLENTLFGG